MSEPERQQAPRTEPRPDVGARAKRALPIIPIALAVAAAVAAAVFAWSHMFAKGTAPQQDATPAEVATAQTAESRGPYTTRDYAEPDMK